MELANAGGSHIHVLFECECHRDEYLEPPRLKRGDQIQCQRCGFATSVSTLANAMNDRYKHQWRDSLAMIGISRQDDSVPPVIVPHHHAANVQRRTWYEHHQEQLFRTIAGLVFSAPAAPEPITIHVSYFCSCCAFVLFLWGLRANLSYFFLFFAVSALLSLGWYLLDIQRPCP
jgi:hypothetical protein